MTTQGASWIASLLTCDAIRSRSHLNGSSFSNAPITAASDDRAEHLSQNAEGERVAERQARAHADALAQALAGKPDIASKPDIADVKLSIAENKV